MSYLGADGSVVSWNLYAYCGNNPISGYDPYGNFNWEGFIIGMGMTVLGVKTIPGAISNPLALSASMAVAATGLTMMYAAATDSAMVIDVSSSYAFKSVPMYVKAGSSTIIDFGDDGGIYGYSHAGGGIGGSTGPSFSVGIVSNFEKPDDYSGLFRDRCISASIGCEYCFSPNRDLSQTTKALGVTFGSGLSFSCGLDYYSKPIVIAKW